MKTCPRCDTKHSEPACPECGWGAPEPITPMAIFELMRARAITMLETTLMESGKAPMTPEVLEGVYKPLLGIGIAAATEHYAAHPEHIAWAAAPMCSTCREPVQTLQVGVDPARDEDDTHVVKVAWPCGHIQ